MRGQKLNITQLAAHGENEMTILVTNTLINRVSAMKESPPVPENLVSRFGSAKSQESGQPREFGFKPLPASGLIGPIRVIAAKKIRF